MMKLFMELFVVLAAGLLLAGCASPGSPRIAVEKNQTIHIHPGEHARHITVDASYHQESSTDVESALEQALDIQTEADVER